MSEDESGRMTAAGRVFTILDVFGASRAPLTTAEISRRANLSMTTTHRLLHEMLDWGAVARDRSGRYELGTKVLELAASSGAAMRLREQALPALLRLHRMLRIMVVHLSIRDGPDTVYIESLRSARGGVGANRIGGRVPLHVTAAGRILLAYAEPQDREAYLAIPLASYTRYTDTDPDALRAELDAIRERQSAVTTRQVTENTGGVAAPVFDPDGRIVAAVGVVLTLKDHHLEDYLEMVKAAAAQISRAITPRD
ncbi:IclR family transcriptional regulator [Microbacterium sp. SORGH_AS_0888]|uniref:IclR family transcriptional regulator n=1 Tax=Microbacterium sp. SORGH_AS_0888 TaxID=3041791 RepID=UPI0027857F32|nr:IclR family transcriptional regulator [Microbacterium sp. SORGH_AS_0888]MDQ1129708.1 DNA-binding IclR family transcriptional regulator [Microbacterium sp. SORGH_AS_0888]